MVFLKMLSLPSLFQSKIAEKNAILKLPINFSCSKSFYAENFEETNS